MKRKVKLIIAVICIISVGALGGVYFYSQNRAVDTDVKASAEMALAEDGFVCGADGVSKEEFDEAQEPKEEESDDVLLQLMEQHEKQSSGKSEWKPVSKKEAESSNAKSDNSGKSAELNTIVGSQETSDVEILGDFDISVPEKPADGKEPDLSEVPFDLAYPDAFDSGEIEYSANSVLIKFKKSDNGKLTDELKTAGIGKLEPLFAGEEYKWFTGYLYSDADVNETMESVRKMDSVIAAEYNYKYETTSTEDASLVEAVTGNELAEEQWYLNQCGIGDGWTALNNAGINPGGARSVTVAVIDTGVDYNHKDLKNNIWINNDEIPDNGIDDDGDGYIDDYYGVDITAHEGSGMDDNGHGTHVAGIIAAENNEIGVVGVAYNTKIMPIKAGDASGYFLQSNIAEAIIYAFEHGADVINMSFGGSASSIAVQDALATAYARCVLVAAAGNDGSPNEKTTNLLPNPCYPADFNYVLGVASCGSSNRESVFSNWDVRLYNKHEYEVYAPGEAIMSTLPNDKYGKLSGTSMAAPVVAAQAALIRSYYTDRETYSTKFIYGQIVGTADDVISCCNPNVHRDHNIPGKINLIRALEELPTPDVNVSDYTIFDTAGFTADTEGLTQGCELKNNGDGIVDAGETIALGFMLKNRWGKSKNTRVHIDSVTQLTPEDEGVANPYVEFLNNDLDYGSIGTYSENDCGKLYNGDEWIAWENPFYLKISENCPNNYTVKVNVTVTCENGLDEGDATVYQSGVQSFYLVVRKGVILPNKITEDMTLTNENYYIIPNSMMIMEGATLTVEKGTKIQFWCSDPSDAYADTAITYLKVNGNLICKGTEEEPVEIFPSDWMDTYRVEIYKSGNGYIGMEYTNVTNPVITADQLSNCEFRQNYARNEYNYRYLSNGNVRTSSSNGKVQAVSAKECTFYKVGSNSSWGLFDTTGGIFERCAFIDSAISYNASSYTDCLFYGNNNYEDSKYAEYNGSAGSITLGNNDDSFSVSKIYRNPEAGRIYVLIQENTVNNIHSYDRFAKKSGGSIASFETPEEVNEVLANFSEDTIISGVKAEDYTYINWNGTEFPEECVINAKRYSNGGFFTDGKLDFSNLYGSSYLLEIPETIYATNIELGDYLVNMDMNSQYTIHATVYPSVIDVSELIFESEDPGIATVDESGIVTPVSTGTVNIKVYAPDRAIYNYVTVNVKDYVALESIQFTKEELQINVGDSKNVKLVFNPVDTTRKIVTYLSDHPEIAEVSSTGTITAKAEGDAVITATGDQGITASMNVHCVIPVEAIHFSQNYYETSLTSEEDLVVTSPIITPENATDQTLRWKSSNPDVCYVDENGKLVKNSAGMATLEATVAETELSDKITVVVNENEIAPIKAISVKQFGNSTFVLTEDGSLYVMNARASLPQKTQFVNVKDFSVYDEKIYILDKDGTLTGYYAEFHNGWEYAKDCYSNSAFGSLENISQLSAETEPQGHCYAIGEDGTLWAWGDNSSGQLGIESSTKKEKPVEVDISEKVVKAVAYDYTGAFLTDQGNVYLAGSYEKQYSEPQLITGSVKDIYSFVGGDFAGLIKEDCIERITGYSGVVETVIANEEERPSGGMSYYLENGKVFVKGENNCGNLGVGTSEYISEYTEMKNVSGITEVFPFYSQVYVIDENGQLYGSGASSNNRLGFGIKEDAYVPQKITLPSENVTAQLVPVSWNGADHVNGNGILTDTNITVFFNDEIVKGNAYGDIRLSDENNAMVSISKAIDFNQLTITPKNKLTIGAKYRLVIPAEAVKSNACGNNDSVTLEFLYKPVNHQTTSDERPLTGLSFNKESITMERNTVKLLSPIYAPADTTQKAVTFESSDPSVASVSSKGVITAKKAGMAVITVKGANGFSAELEVNVVVSATGISFGQDFYETALNGSEDEFMPAPTIIPADSTDTNIEWSSSNPDICEVDESGKLIKNQAGLVTITAKLSESGLEASVMVSVTDTENSHGGVVCVKENDYHTFVLTENGSIYAMGQNLAYPKKLNISNVKDFILCGSADLYALDNDGTVNRYSMNQSDSELNLTLDNSFALNNISRLCEKIYSSDHCYAIGKDGQVWAWGSNSYGQLGNGTTISSSDPVAVDLDATIVKAVSFCNSGLFLDDNGNVYLSGSLSRSCQIPELVYENAVDIYANLYDASAYVVLKENTIEICGTSESLIGNQWANDSRDIKYLGDMKYYISGGKVFLRGSNNSGRFGIGSDDYCSDFEKMAGIETAKEIFASANRIYTVTTDGKLFASGDGSNNRFGMNSPDKAFTPVEITLPNGMIDENFTFTGWNGSTGTVKGNRIILEYNQFLNTGSRYPGITLTNSEGESISISKTVKDNKLIISPKADLVDGETYTLVTPEGAVKGCISGGNAAQEFGFVYEAPEESTIIPDEEEDDSYVAPDEDSGDSTDVPDAGDTDDADEPDEELPEEVHTVVIDDQLLAEREIYTAEDLLELWKEFLKNGFNPRFYSNAIINRLSNDDTQTWLRVSGYESSDYVSIPLGENYWGTTSEKLINKQILDFDDFQHLADIDASNYLIEAPDTTFPFVTDAYLTVNGEQADVVGNEEVTFVVEFNRAMDREKNIEVAFGSAYPYRDYTVSGEFVSDTRWEGTITLKTLIENGYQYFSISNGRTAADSDGKHLKHYTDWGRFPFKIDTSGALSLTMQAVAEEDGIHLTWEQDDFDTLAGYNVYRATSEDGFYTKLNRTVIPADTKTWLDDTVEPGETYYYNFTVVETDFTESEPSGKVTVQAKDTMAPNIYHTPVSVAYTESNLIISATIIDNVAVSSAKVFYRVSGTEEWKSIEMAKNNDKYSGVIDASYITEAGLEYYIDAFDGVKHTYKGTAEEPISVMVQVAITQNSLGDVDGNGKIELVDAMMLLMAVNDRINLTSEQFIRADLDGNGELSAKEALRIMMYVNGTISSVI